MKPVVSAAAWNAVVRVGTRVRYWPIAGESRFVDSRTRSEAWELGHGQPVVSIDRVRGGVSLEHLLVIPTAPAKEATRNIDALESAIREAGITDFAVHLGARAHVQPQGGEISSGENLEEALLAALNAKNDETAKQLGVEGASS